MNSSVRMSGAGTDASVMRPTDLYIYQAKKATDSTDFTIQNDGCMGGFRAARSAAHALIREICGICGVFVFEALGGFSSHRSNVKGSMMHYTGMQLAISGCDSRASPHKYPARHQIRKPCQPVAGSEAIFEMLRAEATLAHRFHASPGIR